MGRSKLNRLSALGRLLRLAQVGAALAGLALMPAAAQDKDTLVWLLRDLPPLTILEGAQKTRGRSISSCRC